MEINLGNVKFGKSYPIVMYCLTVFSPPIVFTLVYNFSIIEKIEALKLIVVSIAVGGFIYLVNMSFAAIAMTVAGSIGSKPEADDEIDDLGLSGAFGLIFTTIINLVTIGNLIWVKFYLIEKKKYWLKASLDVWCLSELLFLAFLIIFLIAVYAANFHFFTGKRRKWSVLEKQISKMHNKKNP